MIKPFLPPKLSHIAFGLLLSGLMTFIVTGIATVNAMGFVAAAQQKWLSSWATSWLVAFPVVLFVAPFVRWLVAKITITAETTTDAFTDPETEEPRQ